MPGLMCSAWTVVYIVAGLVAVRLREMLYLNLQVFIHLLTWCISIVTMYAVQCTMYIVRCTVYVVPYTMHNVRRRVYGVLNAGCF